MCANSHQGTSRVSRGEQPTSDGRGELIMAEEPMPVECGEGEELVDGQCQVIPIEEETVSEEE